MSPLALLERLLQLVPVLLGISVVVFFMMAAAPALAPVVASLHAAQETAGLERVVVNTARTTFLLSLPVALGLIIFGRWYLVLFGPEFTEATVPLTILSIGQLVNVACGPVGMIMIMTGQEGTAARLITVAAVANVVLCASLIPLWGMNGAAIGSAGSLVLLGALLVVEVRRKIGIQCTCVGRLR